MNKVVWLLEKSIDVLKFVLLVFLVVVIPINAQDTIREASEVSSTFNLEAVIGMLVVAGITIVLTIIDGFKTGRIVQSLENSVRLIIGHEGIGQAVESRVAQWSPKSRNMANSLLNVIDPFTDFSFTDLDDEVKATLRDWFDGVVEPAGESLAKKVPAEGVYSPKVDESGS